MAENDGGTRVFAVRGRPGQLTAEDGNYTAAKSRAEDRGSHDRAEYNRGAFRCCRGAMLHCVTPPPGLICD